MGVCSHLNGKSPIESDKIMISGTDKQKMVLAYRLTFLTVIDEKYGIGLPIIIDTIDKETDEKNMNLIINFISNEFSEHQIFISTIRMLGSDDYQIIELKDGLFDKRVDPQQHIDDY